MRSAGVEHFFGNRVRSFDGRIIAFFFFFEIQFESWSNVFERMSRLTFQSSFGMKFVNFRVLRIQNVYFKGFE